MDSGSGQTHLELKGFMKGKSGAQLNPALGHGGWVTAMEVGEIVDGDQTKEFLISGSRDKTLMVWDIQEKNDTDADKEWGVPKKVFKGTVPQPYLPCRPLSLRERPCSLSGQQVRSFWFMGRHPPPLGPQEGPHHQEIRQPLQRCPLCGLLARQQTDC